MDGGSILYLAKARHVGCVYNLLIKISEPMKFGKIGNNICKYDALRLLKVMFSLVIYVLAVNMLDGWFLPAVLFHGTYDYDVILVLS